MTDAEALERYADALELAKEYIADTHSTKCRCANGERVLDTDNCLACLTFYRLKEALEE